MTGQKEQAMFGAGCFWGVEAEFRKIDGVLDAAVGYSGGDVVNPTYEDVCTGITDHAEVVHLTFDPAKVSYKALLEAFWQMHDPTTLNQQGPDRGSQYRSAVFYYDDKQQDEAQGMRRLLDDSGKFKSPIVTEITSASTFYRGEEYHQRYFEKQSASGKSGHCRFF